jgi:osmotically-inducible protein OsmY
MTYSDSELQRDVTAELKWDPSLRDDDIAVGVREGIVTLGGFVDSYAEKGMAERAAGQVKGVKAIANELEVRVPGPFTRSDPEIAGAARQALEWNVAVPHDRIQITVEKGWITLTGQVEVYYQKETAERAVRYLKGVRGVSNLITLAARTTPRDVQQRIKAALHRAAELDAGRIAVEITANTATLTGTVRSYAELKDAERAARNAPGITEVENHIAISGALAPA